ncbi:unnamed protein product [Ceutorhynchus assimilis]|uniref:Uncharacterized protein n=1 Tax=Ceutorhynchus assimilis TaxID=467358 RepID=A0A9N9QGZ9_9CUCU|nr:unnamed protein product [Ceutorhynchus assimilis]
MHDDFNVHGKVREVTRKGHKNNCKPLVNEAGEIIIDAKKKKEAWNTYLENLFHDVPGYTSEVTTSTQDQLEEKTARLELTGVGGSWEPLRIRCEASLFRLYRAKSLQVEVKPDTPRPASVLLLGPSSSTGSPTASPLDPFWIFQELLALLVLEQIMAWLNIT